MGHIALYRRFRPSTFDEIVEQKHAVTALRQAVISGSIAHAYLFSGTRGTGKTSIAKIFSRAVNCLSPQNGNPCNQCEICLGILDGTLLDVIEMDAASNNSVDNIRRVCDEVMFLPSRARYKVYIIDEVHMLSGGAFNALLKTLEEPPAHAIFILATTEPHRIPATIISRCQRYDFRRIPTDSMILRLKEIAESQQVEVLPDALSTIANLSDGALRDAISLLDQVATGAQGPVTRDDVLKITGVVDDAFLAKMSSAVLSDDPVSIISLTEQLIMDGRDLIRFTLDLAHYFRDVLIIKLAPHEESLVQATSASIEQMRTLGEFVSEKTLTEAITRLSSLVSELKWSPDMRTSFEITLLSFGFANRPEESSDARPANLFPKRSTPESRLPVEPKTNTLPEAAQAQVSIPSPEVVKTQAISSAPEVINAQTISPSLSPSALTPPEIVSPVTPGIASVEPARPVSGAAYMPPPPLEDPVHRQIDAPTEAMKNKSLPVPEDNGSIEQAFPPLYPMPEPPDFPEQTDMFQSFTQPALQEDNIPSYPPESDPSYPDEPIPAAGVSVSDVPRSSVPDTIPQESGAGSGQPALPLSALWETLLHRWMDTMFSDMLQLKNASVFLEGDTFKIIFPDAFSAYVKSLTGRVEYKTIMKDIQTVVGHASNILVQTSSQDKQGVAGEAATGIVKPAQEKWVENLLQYSEAEGIPVEIVEDL